VTRRVQCAQHFAFPTLSVPSHFHSIPSSFTRASIIIELPDNSSSRTSTTTRLDIVCSRSSLKRYLPACAATSHLLSQVVLVTDALDHSTGFCKDPGSWEGALFSCRGSFPVSRPTPSRGRRCGGSCARSSASFYQLAVCPPFLEHSTQRLKAALLPARMVLVTDALDHSTGF
jgi:hypothetical protein